MKGRWLAWLALWPALVLASVSAVDDTGQAVTLAQPARRIVSLAPHATESLYAIGAGALLVGTTDFSDWPAEARRLPRVGGYAGVSVEKVLALRPDLVVGWASGNAPREIARLRALGVPVFLSEPSSLEQVASTFERLGVLTARQAAGRREAAGFRQAVASARQAHAGLPVLDVFVQVSETPLLTVNGRQFLSALLEVCGGRNLFAGLPQLVPQVSPEAVLAARPQVMLVPGPVSRLERWRRWPQIPAVATGQLHGLPQDWVSRPGPRLVRGMDAVCQALDQARGSHPGAPS
ncbi:MAG: cobalamin-binding protein [Laribacter sp.]|nr:cobalamin-binding protein [Laribacter sp.]MBP9528393.1 cobalamin-binding protein [Laribacter sp.]MBP9609455.1 cobalamin-binding protein [Laribacter sp.]